MIPELEALLATCDEWPSITIRRFGKGFRAGFGEVLQEVYGYGVTCDDAMQDLCDNLALQGKIPASPAVTVKPEVQG